MHFSTPLHEYTPKKLLARRKLGLASAQDGQFMGFGAAMAMAMATVLVVNAPDPTVLLPAENNHGTANVQRVRPLIVARMAMTATL